MAQALETPEASSVADGETASFNIPFTFKARSEVEVVVETALGARTVQVLDTDYEIPDGDWLETGGDVVFLTGHLPAENAHVERRRITPADQDEPFGDQETFRPVANESAFDKATRQAAEAKAVLDRTAQTPVGEPGLQFPRAAARRGRVLGFEDTDNALPLAVPNSAVAVAEDLARAETAAETATNKAAIATDQADIATEKADAAEAARAQAEVERIAAGLSAEDAAAFAATIDDSLFYDTTAAGIAATVNGQFFKLKPVPTVGVAIYKNVAGVAVLQDTLQSVGYLARHRQRVECLVVAYVAGPSSSRTLRPARPEIVFIGDCTQYEVWYEEVAEPGVGAYDIILQNGDGTASPLGAGGVAMKTRAGTAPGSGGTAVGDVVTVRRRRAGEANQFTFLLLEGRNTAIANIAPTIDALGHFGQNVNVDRPLAVTRTDRNIDRIKLKPHPSHYLNGQPQLDSDMVEFAQMNLRDFQNDPGGAPSLNSGFARIRGRLIHGFNFLNSGVDSGLTVKSGLVPSTSEPPQVVGKASQTAAQHHLAGINHGGMASTEWDARLWLNDLSTGTIQAIGLTNPMTITLNLGAYVTGQRLIPRGVLGTTQINDQILTVLSTALGGVGGLQTVVTIDLDATGFSAFTGHTGGIDRESLDLSESAINAALAGDKYKISFTALLETSAASALAPVLIAARVTYLLTYESVADHLVELETIVDFTDAGITTTPSWVRGFAMLQPFMDVDRAQAIIGGVAQTPRIINTRDATSTVVGQPEKIKFWHSTFEEFRWVLENKAGATFSHWEDDGLGGGYQLVPKVGGQNAYITNNDNHVKFYENTGDATGLTKRTMTGVKLRSLTTISVEIGDPIPGVAVL